MLAGCGGDDDEDSGEHGDPATQVTRNDAMNEAGRQAGEGMVKITTSTATELAEPRASNVDLDCSRALG